MNIDWFHISLILFVYMLGCQWTLIAITLFDTSYSKTTQLSQLIQSIILWPLLVFFVTILYFTESITRVLEVTGDYANDVWCGWKHKRR